MIRSCRHGVFASRRYSSSLNTSRGDTTSSSLLFNTSTKNASHFATSNRNSFNSTTKILSSVEASTLPFNPLLLPPSTRIRRYHVLASSSFRFRPSTKQVQGEIDDGLIDVNINTNDRYRCIGTNEVRTKLTMNEQQTLFQLQLVRWKGRNDGARFDHKERKPSRKATREYNRRQKALEQKIHKTQPGAKANVKREWYGQLNEMALDDARQLMELGPNATSLDLPDPFDEIGKSNQYTLADALVDDMFNNTQAEIAQSKIEPHHTGHKHSYYFSHVSKKMRKYQRALDQQKQQQAQLGQATTTETTPTISLPPERFLPSDLDIALALRSYRDKNGTKRNPVGIMSALRLVLHDLQVPLSEFGEYTYTSLLTCCRTVAEGRRVFQLMKERSHPISSYSYSILVDIAARHGDYKTCVAIHQEMVTDGGRGCAPTVASYTSLLAACYKVCADGGHVPHAVRAEASKVAWESWKEMIISGIEPDAQAYGAHLRIVGVLGQPERALNILDEMQMKQIKPTTLCYTSALRAVARSQSTAIRYEHGSSVKNKRREFITKHHGTMAKTILIKVESDEVHQDEGFIAALALCAAEAGDVATAKAIYISHQIRNVIYPRIVPNAMLWEGQDDQQTLIDGIQSYINGFESDGNPSSIVEGITSTGHEGTNTANETMDSLTVSSSNLNNSINQNNGKGVINHMNNTNNNQYVPKTHQQREYGDIDNRVLTALLHACARSADPTMIGTMWQGRENDGYLCENSLRLIVARKIPNYEPQMIPGASISDNLTTDELKYGRTPDEYREGKRVGKKGRKAFAGVYVDPDAYNTSLEDLDETLEPIYFDKEGQLKKEFQRTTPEEIWKMKYGPTRSGINEYPEITTEPGPDLLGSSASSFSESSIPPSYGRHDIIEVNDDDYKEVAKNDIKTPKENELYFDYDTMSWKTKGNQDSENLIQTSSSSSSNDNDIPKTKGMFFDYDTMSWKTSNEIDNVEYEVIGGPTTSSSANSVDKTIESTLHSTGEYTSEASMTERLTSSTASIYGSGEMYFDQNDMLWKVNPNFTKQVQIMASHSLDEKRSLHDGDGSEWRQSEKSVKDDELIRSDEANKKDFQSFLVELQHELDLGGDMEVSEEEARELFEMMKDEYTTGNRRKQSSMELSNNVLIDAGTMSSADRNGNGNLDSQNFDELPTTDAEMQAYADNFDFKSAEKELEEAFKQQGLEWDEETQDFVSADKFEDDDELIDEGIDDDLDSPLAESDEDVTSWQMDELRKYLPQYSESRRLKILKVMETSLGKPQLYDLIELTREKMPDYVTSTWLKQMAALTAKFVMYQAAQDGKINSHLIDSAIELQASAGGIESAIEAHAKLFDEYRMVPTEYSDRLVLQMLLKNNRLQRALAFKQNVESQGRTLDMKSYGSLVDYFGRHEQPGSAMLMLKECISVHSSPPSEASVARLRVLFRQSNLDQRILTDLVGRDPIQWLKDGQANLKREQSKKGRRGISEARNVLLRV